MQKVHTEIAQCLVWAKVFACQLLMLGEAFHLWWREKEHGDQTGLHVSLAPVLTSFLILSDTSHTLGISTLRCKAGMILSISVSNEIKGIKMGKIICRQMLK